MSLERLEMARRASHAARARLDSTLVAFQHRLRPANLAGEAWDGVKDKSADLADSAFQMVRRRPAAVSVTIGALALFLARAPLKRAASRLFFDNGDEGNDGHVVTRIETDDARFTATAPLVDADGQNGVI